MANSKISTTPITIVAYKWANVSFWSSFIRVSFEDPAGRIFPPPNTERIGASSDGLKSAGANLSTRRVNPSEYTQIYAGNPRDPANVIVIPVINRNFSRKDEYWNYEIHFVIKKFSLLVILPAGESECYPFSVFFSFLFQRSIQTAVLLFRTGFL